MKAKGRGKKRYQNHRWHGFPWRLVRRANFSEFSQIALWNRECRQIGMKDVFDYINRHAQNRLMGFPLNGEHFFQVVTHNKQIRRAVQAMIGQTQ